MRFESLCRPAPALRGHQKPGLLLSAGPALRVAANHQDQRDRRIVPIAVRRWDASRQRSTSSRSRSRAGRRPFGDGVSVQDELGGNDWPADDEQGRSWNEMRVARAFRRATVVTTYTAIGMTLWEENFPASFASADVIVRTLP